MPSFRIRPGTLAAGDDKWFLTNFDSQLAWLASQGSEGQWGSTPRSTNEEQQAKFREKVERSERMRNQSFSRDWIGSYVAEAEVPETELSPELRSLVASSGADAGSSTGVVRIPVAGLVLDSKSADYVEMLPEQDEHDPFVYVSYLMSDRRLASIGKGAGAVLLDHAKQEVLKLGVRRLCLDCWRGNDRKLIKYYESQGYKVIGEFGVAEKGSWPGAVMEMRL